MTFQKNEGFEFQAFQHFAGSEDPVEKFWGDSTVHDRQLTKERTQFRPQLCVVRLESY